MHHAKDLARQSAFDARVAFGKSARPGLRLLVTFTTKVSVPVATTLDQQIADFWEERHVTFHKKSNDELVGSRGSLWWNPITFNMSRLKSDLVVRIDRNSGAIVCELDVNTVLQTITPMNKKYWIEEMRSFEDFLASGTIGRASWDKFGKDYRNANIRWTLGLVLGGSAPIIWHFAKDWIAKLTELLGSK